MWSEDDENNVNDLFRENIEQESFTKLETEPIKQTTEKDDIATEIQALIQQKNELIIQAYEEYQTEMQKLIQEYKEKKREYDYEYALAFLNFKEKMNQLDQVDSFFL
eukprot:Anaeramoba_ignava/a242621_9.p1 GENE.a242621_9~~a242621_9.p1  ORF type:complete len:107 (-),score=48.61 a242621_9:1-321(-)